MKRFRILGVAFFAVFALCALDVVAATPAVAVTVCVELLAETSLWEKRSSGGVCEVELLTATSLFEMVTFLLALWLHAGAEVISELTTEASSGTGGLLLEDTGAKVAVVCSGILDGWVGPNSLDWISEVLTLAGTTVKELVAAETIACTVETGTCGEPKIWAIHLGWETEVELWETGTALFGGLTSGFAVLILPHTGGENPGWETECTVLGIKAVDTCKGAEGVFELSLNAAELLGKFSEEFTELMGVKLGECSIGGVETGNVESSEGLGGLITLTGGGELTASSETAVA